MAGGLRGLALGQKNDAGVTAAERDRVGFDFGVVAECGQYDECRAFVDLYAGRVLVVEYTDDGLQGACRALAPGHPWFVATRRFGHGPSPAMCTPGVAEAARALARHGLVTTWRQVRIQAVIRGRRPYAPLSRRPNRVDRTPDLQEDP